MNWNPRSMVHRVRSVPAHLHDLASYLRDLSGRVRQSVAEAVGSTVGRAVQDTLTLAWTRAAPSQPAPQRREPEIDPYDWSETPTQDPWDLEEPERETSHPVSPTVSPASPDAPMLSKTPWLGLAMKAAGWWLYRRGSWYGALGLGLLIGGVGLVGGPLALAGLGLVEAASEAAALNKLLSTGAVTLAAV